MESSPELAGTAGPAGALSVLMQKGTLPKAPTRSWHFISLLGIRNGHSFIRPASLRTHSKEHKH